MLLRCGDKSVGRSSKLGYDLARKFSRHDRHYKLAQPAHIVYVQWLQVTGKMSTAFSHKNLKRCLLHNRTWKTQIQKYVG